MWVNCIGRRKQYFELLFKKHPKDYWNWLQVTAVTNATSTYSFTHALSEYLKLEAN